MTDGTLTARRLGVAGAILLVLCAVILRCVFAGVSLAHVPATADEASAVLLAEQIAHGKPALLFIGQPYQFPIEAYLLALTVHWMPHNAFGARYLTLLLGLLSAAVFLVIARRVLPAGSRWPAVLLLLFPSAYWLMTQAAYTPPQYSASVFLSALLVYTVHRAGLTPHRRFLAFLAGLLGGLALSNHLLVLPIVAAAGAVVGLGRGWRETARGTACFAAGALIGLMPYFLAGWLCPGANEEVGQTLPLAKWLRRLLDPMLSATLPGALGVEPPLFPDFDLHVRGVPALRLLIVSMYGLTLAAVLIHSGVAFVRRIMRDRWPSVELPDLFAGASVLTLLLFGASRRATAESHRYLLIAVWFFPLLIGYLHSLLPRRGRFAMGAFALGLAVLNLGTSAVLIREWCRPDFAVRAADTPDIRSLLAQLDGGKIRRCYASFWLAYRITYESRGHILCAPPYNERFFGWPIPFKDIVDQAPDAAYVMTDTFSSRFKRKQFEEDLATFNISAERQTLGPFTIYRDFRHAPSERDVAVTATECSFAAASQTQTINLLRDGNPQTCWRSREPQRPGLWVQGNLVRPRPIQRLTLYYPKGTRMFAPVLRVLGQRNGNWSPLRDDAPMRFDRLRCVGGRPIYGDAQQTLWFTPATVDAVRLEIVTAAPDRPWAIGEIEIGAAEAPTAGPAETRR
jgi:hypothetical protein